MKISVYKNLIQSLITLFIIATSALVFASCSSESITQENKEKQKGEETFHFTEIENGEDIQYEINFYDGSISSVYKDGIKIPGDKIKDYEDLVYDKLKYLRKDKDDFFSPGKPYAFHLDMDDFHSEMDSMRKNLKEHKVFNFKFDHENFQKEMDGLKENLKGLDDIVIHIDDKIQGEIDESLKHLDKLKLHKFNFDEDEFDGNMKRITIELEKDNDDPELNLDNLEEDMKDLEEKMGELSEEMKDLDKEIKILNEFLELVKAELVKDGFIKNIDEEFDMELSSSEMSVNGVEVPANLLSKYKEMYKEHFNKELKGKLKFTN